MEEQKEQLKQQEQEFEVSGQEHRELGYLALNAGQIESACEHFVGYYTDEFSDLPQPVLEYEHQEVETRELFVRRNQAGFKALEIAKLYFRLGKYEAVCEWANTCLCHQPESCQAKGYYALALLKLGQIKQAEAMLTDGFVEGEQAANVRLQRENGKLYGKYFSLAKAAYSKEDYQLAGKHVRDALKFTPNHPEGLLLAYRARLKLSNWDEAKSILLSLLSSKPDSQELSIRILKKFSKQCGVHTEQKLAFALDLYKDGCYEDIVLLAIVSQYKDLGQYHQALNYMGKIRRRGYFLLHLILLKLANRFDQYTTCFDGILAYYKLMKGFINHLGLVTVGRCAIIMEDYQLAHSIFFGEEVLRVPLKPIEHARLNLYKAITLFNQSQIEQSDECLSAAEKYNSSAAISCFYLECQYLKAHILMKRHQFDQALDLLSTCYEYQPHRNFFSLGIKPFEWLKSIEQLLKNDQFAEVDPILSFQEKLEEQPYYALPGWPCCKYDTKEDIPFIAEVVRVATLKQEKMVSASHLPGFGAVFDRLIDTLDLKTKSIFKYEGEQFDTEQSERFDQLIYSLQSSDENLDLKTLTVDSAKFLAYMVRGKAESNVIRRFLENVIPAKKKQKTDQAIMSTSSLFGKGINKVAIICHVMQDYVAKLMTAITDQVGELEQDQHKGHLTLLQSYLDEYQQDEYETLGRVSEIREQSTRDMLQSVAGGFSPAGQEGAKDEDGLQDSSLYDAML